MPHYQLNMTGIQWNITVPIEFDPDEKMAPFLTEEKNADVYLSFEIGRPEIPGEVLWKDSPKVWKDRSRLWVERTLTVRALPSGCICIDPEQPGRIRGWIYPEHVGDIHSMEALLDISEMEVHLARHGIISLHSSLIRWKGKGILFTAPSGTGKSTQADLWEQYRKAEQLNGDRSMIRKTDGIWTAYGSPFAGSSGIYKNESAPVQTIVVLRQAPKNHLKVLNQAEGFRMLYSETVIPRWNAEIHKEIIRILEDLTASVPILMLECVPEESAVRILEEYLGKMDYETAGSSGFVVQKRK